MKDEIKEMLELHIKNEIDLLPKNQKKVLNYITNLQEELKSANESITWWTNRFKAVERDNERLAIELNKNMIERNNYLSRNEKAIEYIEKSMNNPQPFYEYLFGDENGKVENLDKLLNIINGDEE